MDLAEMRGLPRWFVLALALSLLALAAQALLTGVIESPSSYAFLRSEVTRAADPAEYWGLLVTYFVGGAALLVVALRRFQSAEDEYEPLPPPPPRPGWARALAWSGVAFSALLLAGAGYFAIAGEPIISLPFVLFLGAGGLMIGFACAGYLVTGRIQ